MLALDHLRVSYDGVPALTDVSLEVGAGQIVALVGGNGNGKSTTLRAAAGLNALEGGSITFEGRAVHGRRHTSGCRSGCRWCRRAAACFRS